MFKKQYLKKPASVFTLLMLLGAVGNTSTAPELPLLEQAKSSAEYPILKQLQSLTFDLQMLELVVKNRRDPNIESKISGSIEGIQNESSEIRKKFAELRGSQIGTIAALFNSAKKHTKTIGVEFSELEEILTSLREGRIQEGMLVVHPKHDSLNLLVLSPVRIGKQVVWNVSLPESDNHSFWRKLYRNTGNKMFSAANLRKKLEPVSELHKDAMKIVEVFYKESHKKLYDSFEEQRYGIMTRMVQARKALVELGRKNSAMGAPEEFGALYNQLLENLYSYGVDISFNGEQRDFKIKGILFGDSPETAKELLSRLKFNSNSATFSSPTS